MLSYQPWTPYPRGNSNIEVVGVAKATEFKLLVQPIAGSLDKRIKGLRRATSSQYPGRSSHPTMSTDRLEKILDPFLNVTNVIVNAIATLAVRVAG